MVKAIFHPIMGGGVTIPDGDYLQAFALEFIITFNLMFVVTAVATDTRAVSKLHFLFEVVTKSRIKLSTQLLTREIHTSVRIFFEIDLFFK